jgi:hypothetical protein
VVFEFVDDQRSPIAGTPWNCIDLRCCNNVGPSFGCVSLSGTVYSCGFVSFCGLVALIDDSSATGEIGGLATGSELLSSWGSWTISTALTIASNETRCRCFNSTGVSSCLKSSFAFLSLSWIAVS